MGDRVRKGDFLVPKEDLEKAEDAFEERSPRSRSADKATRAPITTDGEVYERLGGRVVDYPGVDTPTENPSEAVGDFNLPGEMEGAYERGDFEVSTSDETTGPVQEAGEQGRSLIDAILGGK